MWGPLIELPKAITMSSSAVYVYFVIHQKLPTYSMYFRDDVYSEPIDTVNATVVAVYDTEAKAERAAKEYFENELGLIDNCESENNGYYCAAHDMDGSDSGTWDEEVYVEHHRVQ